jgi:hypothetical protein
MSLASDRQSKRISEARKAADAAAERAENTSDDWPKLRISRALEAIRLEMRAAALQREGTD